MIKQKKGQIQMSFGMIFSIIIIIATIAVAIYIIIHFLNVSNCAKNGAFWDSLENNIDKAWKADSIEQVYPFDLPSGITHVCFGNFSQSQSKEDRKIFEELKAYSINKKNAYVYPTKKACEGLSSRKLEHITLDKFFCINVTAGKMSIKLSKSTTDVFVKLGKS